jgi:hypothetical protein
MKLTSLLILAALVLGIGYVAIFQRDWVMSLFRSGTEAAEGYTNAESPQQAAQLFTKAIKARKFKTAAKYVKGNYKEHLERAHDAAAEMGVLLDKIVTYAKNKGFDSDTAMNLLSRLDPFPPYFSVEGEPAKDKKDATKAYGRCKSEWAYPNPDVRELNALNLTLPAQPLAPANLFTGMTLVEETAGESKIWKLHIDLPSAQAGLITEYLNKYRSYHSALENFHRDMTNNRHDTKEEFKSRLLDVVRASK